MDDNKKIEQDKLQIRTNTTITEQFKQLAQGFTNQSQAMEALMQSYQEQERKQQLPDSKNQIDQLEASLKTIKNNFLNVLESYNNAKTEAKADYANQIETLTETNNAKDQDITELKKQVEEYKQQIADLKAKLKAKATEIELISTYKTNNAELKTQLQGLQNTLKQAQKNLKDMEESLLEADKTNKDQTQAIWDLETDLKVKNADLDNKIQNIADLKSQIQDLKAQNADLRQDIKNKDNYIAKLNESLVEANINAQKKNKSRDKDKN